MTENKRIVFFIGSMRRGGAERVISILANEYAKKGWKTDIAVLLFNEVGYALHDTVEIIDFSGDTDSRIKRIPYWLTEIRRYMKKEKPDIVVSFAARINVLVLLSCLGIKKEIVVSERNDPGYDGRKWLTKLLVSMLYPCSKAVVFQTDRAMQYFGKRVQNIGVKIPNPISVSVYADKECKKRIVNAGRLASQKNQRLLIDAFYTVANKYPDYTLWIYGTGELESELKKHVYELGISEKVYFPGNVEDVHEQIKDAEIFVLSSDFEGLSNALLEAMMMGLPCISTRCAGSDEVIKDRVNGLLTDVGDKDALAGAIFNLIENDGLRNKIAENARKDAARFSRDTVVCEWEKVIEEPLKK